MRYILNTIVLKRLFTFLFILMPFFGFGQNKLKLWYKKPAKVWTEALPVGNGRLGAMIFGGVKQELIQLNESTLWTGGPVLKNVNPNAYANLLLAREALFKNEDYAKASEYAKKMQGYYTESYLPLGDLKISQDFKDTSSSNYYRDLDIKNAIATTRFTVAGTEYTRQMISSAPDQVMVIHFTASKPGQLNFKLSTACLLKHQNEVISNSEIAIKGKAPAHIQPNYIRTKTPITWDDSTGRRGMRFELLLKAVNNGGTISSDTSGISVKNATEVTVYLSAATSFNGFDKSPVTQGKDEIKLASGYLEKALLKDWSKILSRHYIDYHHYFNRVNFSLKTPAVNTNAKLPTEERLAAYSVTSPDPELETLYFQYSRYLLISSSRPGGVPANLQGIWNKEMRPPWSSNYTTNINVQMNYWPAEVANLSEMHLPFIDYIKNASVTGKETATNFYHTRGWAVHHNSDIWAISNPVGDLGGGTPTWANWSMGSPWLSQHLWWHYQFTKDKRYLAKTAYPIMKSAAQFCMDWLVPYNGHLVTAPSVSPENVFIDDKGEKNSVSIATTMDMAIIWDLFTGVIDASNELETDKSFRDSIILYRKKLYPLHIGKKGNLQEWYKDWEDEDPHHRHVSHLFTVFPGHEISPIETPELATAAKKSLELRGDAGTGWSLAWKINFWARLLDGNHAYKMIHDILKLTGTSGTNFSNGGGSYANLFDAHPPFQIDGNFGALSGMCEMLLQTQSNELNLLPAIPDEWSEGQVSGLRGRGDFEVSMNWKRKKIVTASIYSGSGGLCRLRTTAPISITGINAKTVKTKYGYVTSFATKKGMKYNIVGS
ncbi:alpha-L-fucosidase 2 [Mucilaginibacter gracilis]|uniref:Alpha-L-fucosidase 2 n=1 Tax=Mucilaginibacter gracilis TaxID=423350 RepID=A0A495J803_9SPHI|nr:glycoside hydrolase family 95 protein [Mucilaginibacter gracilis]RKR85115.1 alpha-L-fucosidase 2 [Mucilaginibacter gracilis]